MPLRIVILVAVVMAATAAVAEPDALQRLHRWLWPNAPRQEPVVVSPLPDIRPPEIVLVPVPESPVALPKPRPKSVERQPKRKVPKVVPQPLSGGGQAAPSSEGITCAQARQGVGMPCWLIVQNAYKYERLTAAQKRQADSCLSEAEREAIRACFR